MHASRRVAILRVASAWSRTQFHVERPWGQRPFSIVSYNSVLNVKALVGAFNQEKALVGAFSVIVKTGCVTDGSFYSTNFCCCYQDTEVITLTPSLYRGQHLPYAHPCQ